METEDEVRAAIRSHIEALRGDGLPVPVPLTRAEYVET
jgi:predicted RNase H-like HicB family nuclease